VLPCILADAEGGLIRVNPKLCRQDEPIWLVVHDDIRDTKRVRVVCQFLQTIVRERQSALIGETV
jgi:DNA-binding transcriptional LysR family regulator